MSDPLLVLLLAGGLRDDQTIDAVTKAMRLALGPDAVVLVDTSEARDDTAAVALAERARARAVARVVWADEEHRAAHVDVHVTGDSPVSDPSLEWAHDDLSFADNDAPNERARTVGFAVASMVQHIEAVTAAPAERPLVTPVATPTPDTPPPPPTPMQKHRVAIDATLRGAVAYGGGAANYGGAVGAELWLLRSVAATATFGARFGSIQAAAVSDRLLLAGGGMAVRLVKHAPFEVTARADLLVVQQSASRSYPTGQETRSRWLFGAEVLGEVSYWITANTAFTVGAGVEMVSASTDIDVGSARVADLPVWRGLAQGGFTIRL